MPRKDFYIHNTDGLHPGGWVALGAAMAAPVVLAAILLWVIYG